MIKGLHICRPFVFRMNYLFYFAKIIKNSYLSSIDINHS